MEGFHAPMCQSMGDMSRGREVFDGMCGCACQHYNAWNLNPFQGHNPRHSDIIYDITTVSDCCIVLTNALRRMGLDCQKSQSCILHVEQLLFV